MDGFSKKINLLLKQWKNVFESTIKTRSLHAKNHWNSLIQDDFSILKHKYWRSSLLNKLLKQEFIFSESCNELNEFQIKKLALPINSIFLVFVNGKFKPTLSTQNFKPFEINFRQSEEEIAELPKPIYKETFLHLTESMAEKITTIRLDKETLAAFPIYLLHITTGKENQINMVHYRHHFHIEEGSHAKIIEHYITLNKFTHFTGARFTFLVSDNAHLTHTKLAFENYTSYHFSHNDFKIGSNSKIFSTNYLIGANFIVHNNSAQLNGNNSELLINSLTLPKNDEITDIHSYLEHNKPNCLSRQLHKSIVQNQGKSTFNGHLKVNKKAIKTNGRMINQNLMLDSFTQINTKPKLEIYTDDIQCTHAATIGQIDKEQIFYMRSRGISEKFAKEIIIYSFITELTETIKNLSVRKAILNYIKKRPLTTIHEKF